jgi:hypothetical protein
VIQRALEQLEEFLGSLCDASVVGPALQCLRDAVDDVPLRNSPGPAWVPALVWVQQSVWESEACSPQASFNLPPFPFEHRRGRPLPGRYNLAWVKAETYDVTVEEQRLLAEIEHPMRSGKLRAVRAAPLLDSNVAEQGSAADDVTVRDPTASSSAAGLGPPPAPCRRHVWESTSRFMQSVRAAKQGRQNRQRDMESPRTPAALGR